MPLFKKNKKNAPKKSGKKSGKKSKVVKKSQNQSQASAGAARRKTKSMIQRMGLSEAVATMGLQLLSDVSAQGNSAVRYLGDGYTVVVLDEKMIEDAELDVKDEQFGSFAEALRSEHIKSFLLKNDLDNNRIVLIPDSESLDLLDEYAFIRNTELKWGLIEVDTNDDSQVKVLDNTTTIAELMKIAVNNEPLFLSGNTIEIGSSNQLGDEDVDEALEEAVGQEYDDAEAETETENNEFDDSSYSDDNYDLDDMSGDSDAPLDDFDENSFEDHGDYEDQGNDEDLDIDIDSLVEDSNVVSMNESNAEAVIEKAMTREFYNDELGVEVQADLFDIHFDNNDTQPVLFNDDVVDLNSELDKNVAKMRKDANAEIIAFHNANIQKLRSNYNLAMASFHDDLVEMLDYENKSTDFGKKYEAIEDDRNYLLNAADDVIIENRQELDDAYEAKRKKFAQRAFDDAIAKYDELNINDHDKTKAQIGDKYIAEINAESDAKVSDMYESRRVVAKRMFDKATTSVLIGLQNSYKAILGAELKLQDGFRNDIKKYINENYSDEVMRAKALADELRQTHKADEIRAEYTHMLEVKEDELNQAHIQATNKYNELRSIHQKELSDTTKAWDKKLKESNERHDDLIKQISQLQSDLASVDDKAQAKYKNQLDSANDQIKALNGQLKFGEERQAKSNKIQVIIIVAVSIVAIALGLAIGLMVGSHTASAKSEPVTAQVQQSESPKGGNTYNYNYDKSEDSKSQQSESSNSSKSSTSTDQKSSTKTSDVKK